MLHVVPRKGVSQSIHRAAMDAVRQSITSHGPLLMKIIESNTEYFHSILKKHRLTAIDPDKVTPSAIIQEISNLFKISKAEHMEDQCRKLISSLRTLGTLEAIDLSSQLRTEWKLKIPSLAHETSHKKEIEILKGCGVEPFSCSVIKKEAENKLGICHKNMHVRNTNAARELEKHYTTIVHIICTRHEQFFLKIADRLCEVRLISASVVDQAQKMKVPVMQVKAIMGDVHTMVERGVLPVKILRNLIYVLTLPEFHDAFKCVVQALQQQNYNPSTFKCVHTKRNLTGQNHSEVYMPPTKDKSSSVFSLPPSCMIPTNVTAVEAGSSDDDEYQGYLKSRYRRLKDVSTSYTAFTSRQRIAASKFFNLAVNINHSDAISVLDLKYIPLYDPATTMKHTLIYGGPGVGKSSIVNNLCKGWSKNSLLQEYKYVILLKASDPHVGTAKQLKDLLSKEIQDWMNPIIRADGKGTLFILDAYDEFSEESRTPNGFFDRLIQGDVLGSASIIVTARPWCADEILHHFPNEVEILGFTPESRIEYIQHHLPDKDAEKFLSHPPMVQCTSIPFFLATLVEIFDELVGDNMGGASANVIPTTVTSLFESVIRSLILKFSKSNDKLSKYMHGDINVSLGEFSSCLPPEIYEPFLEICSIAYKTLLMPSLNIPFRSDQIKFGLVTVDAKLHSAGQAKCYKFLHSYIQEFLAAFCISRMKKDQIETCFKSLQASPSQFQLMIEFLYGFGCINEVNRTEYKDYQVITNFKILRQLCESPNSQELIKSVYDQFKHSPKPCIIRRTFPSPSFADFWCLGRVIALSGCQWELGFTYRPIQNEHIEMLRKGFESIDNPEGRIKKLAFSLTRIDEEGIEHICGMSQVHLQHVTEAQFSGNSLTSSVIPILSKAMGEEKFQNLKKFLLHQNVITAGDHMELIIALGAHCPNIEHVAFTGLQKEEYKLLIQLRTLKVIELWRVSSCCIKESFKSLPISRFLEQLEVHQTEVDTEIARILPRTLPQSNIDCLKLINCNIDCELVTIIARAVRDRLRCMKRHCKMSIDLSDNIIRDNGREILSQLQWEGCDILDSYKCNEFTMPNQFGEMKKRPVHHQSGQYRRHQPPYTRKGQRGQYFDRKRH